MKVRSIILAGGEGTRLGVLTAKRTKPAVTFAGKYRIIDFPLSNCVNSNLFDIMIIAQYRPHSLIEHIGAGGPWDLNRDFTGGIRIYTPYKARGNSWFVGTADAVQQNYGFIKRGNPENYLILSGDHIYTMDYSDMIEFHQQMNADVTLAVIEVPIEEAHRFGIVDVDSSGMVTSFIEKPENPPSNLVNMGVYLFKQEILDRSLWQDHLQQDSSHDFGKDILPYLVSSGARVCAYRYKGYWVDVGTVESYWQSHMDLLLENPSIHLNDRFWIIHTRSEEHPPIKIFRGAEIDNSMICDGCVIESGAKIIHSVLSPGVYVEKGAVIRDSIILTDSHISANALVTRAIIDKKVLIGEQAQVGEDSPLGAEITMVGKHSLVPANFIIERGAIVGTDVILSDYNSNIVDAGTIVQTKRLPNEL
jgi:glucose-1-phosphate adenylyltransferase